MTKGLGRRYSPDDRDKQYRLRDALPAVVELPPYKYWWDHSWIGDQGSNGTCTAYSAMHWWTASPHTHKEPFMQPDEWSDNDDDCGTYAKGTSVRAGCKRLVAHDKAKPVYRWVLPDESDALDVVVDALLTPADEGGGPVMLGVNWYEGFDSPTDSGFVRISGHIRFSFDDLERLIREDGEAAVCVEA